MYIIPTILCGGSGDRLWPLSRKSYPKQFLDLIGSESLFQQAARRLGFASKPIVLSAEDYRFIVRQQLSEIGLDEADVIVEPSVKNTAPAILAAAFHSVNTNPNAIMIVMPSDHYIPDEKAFADMVQKAGHNLEDGQILCFGITPSGAETGYGYIKVEACNDSVMPVAAFTEKPDVTSAEMFLRSGEYLWNAGIFMVRARDILALGETLVADMQTAVSVAYTQSQKDLDFIRLDAKAWEAIQGESFDYAFMERAPNIGCVRFEGEWSDLGDWNALAQQQETDLSGNVIKGNAHQSDCENTVLWAQQKDQLIVGHGLSNVIAVAMRDAVLVADRSNPQAIKSIVAALKENNVSQATMYEREHRPWGWFEVIAEGPQFKVNAITVYPEQALSLQSHQHRSEHWVVVKGIATIIQNENVYTLKPNESIYNPNGVMHQLKNLSSENVQIIEVQTGSYFGDNDILRYHDIYDRNHQA